MTAGLEMWSRSPDVAFVDDGERVVLLPLGALPNQPRLLHGSAAAVWRLLQRPCTPTQVAGELSQSAATGALTLEKLETFLTDLASHGLVRPVEDVSP